MLDRVKLAQICEMMRSDSDNERAVAARMATDMLRRSRMSWTDLIVTSTPADGPPESPPPARRPPTRQPPDKPPRTQKYKGVDGQQLVADLLRHRGLSSWEAMFVKTLKQQNPLFGFTDQQWQVLKDVALRHGRWRG